MNKKIRIELTEEQQARLLKLLNYEWDAEIEHQSRNNIPDTSYLEDMLEVYKSCLGKASNLIEAFVLSDDIDAKIEEINKLKEQ